MHRRICICILQRLSKKLSKLDWTQSKTTLKSAASLSLTSLKANFHPEREREPILECFAFLHSALAGLEVQRGQTKPIKCFVEDSWCLASFYPLLCWQFQKGVNFLCQNMGLKLQILFWIHEKRNYLFVIHDENIPYIRV